MNWEFLRKPWRRWLVLPIVFLLVDGLILASISLGIRLPAFGLLAAVSDITGFDYGHHAEHSFEPLSDAYLARQLGLRRASAPGIAAGTRSSGRLAEGRGLPPRAFLNHSFTNDDFENAIAVPELPFTASTTTKSATRQAGEPTSCAPVGGTVWYRFEPIADVTLLVDTVGTDYADAIGVFTGSSRDHLATVGCNTSALGNAQVTFRATRSTRYYFQVTGPTGGGALRFNLTRIGATSMIDVGANGDPPNNNGGISQPAISGDGRYVVFTSSATNLVPSTPRCTTNCASIFVRDLVSGRTELIASGKDRDATQPYFGANAVGTTSYTVSDPVISADGRFVAFDSDRPDLVPNDTNGVFDVFTFDRVTKRTERVSVSSSGGQAVTNPAMNSSITDANTDFPGSSFPSISADGRTVAFVSDASNLVTNDTNDGIDVFVHDSRAHLTELVSVRPDGRQFPEARNFNGTAMSADGSAIAFEATTTCSALPAGTVEDPHVQRNTCLMRSFVRDRARRQTTSLTASAQDYTSSPSISPDGRFVAFYTSNVLVPEDTNQAFDVYLLDRVSNRTSLVSVTSSGRTTSNPNTTGSYARYRVGAISYGGRYVTFSSSADDLVGNDGDGHFDVFVHDMLTGATTLASVSPTGAPGDAVSTGAAISDDGSIIVFMSQAGNLAAGSDASGASWNVFVHENELFR